MQGPEQTSLSSRLSGPYRGIAFLRVSTNKQDVLRQERDIERIAKRYGINIVRWLRLNGVSGRKTLTHKQVQTLLAEVSGADIDGLVCSSVDRLFRPVRPDHYQIGQCFQDFRKFLWTEMDGVIEMWTAEGLSKFIDSGRRSGLELEHIRHRSITGKIGNLRDEDRKVDGFSPRNTGSCWYGYRHCFRDRNTGERAHLEIIPEEAVVVKRCFLWAMAGVGCPTIAARLNLEGVLSKRAGKIDRKLRDGADGTAPVSERENRGKWSATTIRQMLRHECYTGEYSYLPGTEDEVRCTCPKIIERDVFEAVQMMLVTGKEMRSGRSGAMRQYLLTGLGFCLWCGHRITTKTRPFPRGYYRCGNLSKPPVQCLCTGPRHYHIDKDVLEQKVFDTVWGVVSNEDTLTDMITESFIDAPPAEETLAELVELRAQLERLIAVEARAKENIDEPLIPRHEARAHLAKSTKARRDKEFEISCLNQQITPAKGEKPEDATVRALAHELAECKPEGYQEKRDFLKLLVKEFATDGKRVEIELSIPRHLLLTPRELYERGKSLVWGIGKIHTPGEQMEHNNIYRGIRPDICLYTPLTSPITFKINTTL